jgi:hypothetical protein
MMAYVLPDGMAMSVQGRCQGCYIVLDRFKETTHYRDVYNSAYTDGAVRLRRARVTYIKRRKLK